MTETELQEAMRERIELVVEFYRTLESLENNDEDSSQPM
jgi:hypothetical protein